MNNVKKIIKNALCSGCGACYVVCPKNCIEIIEGNLNFPKINESKCSDCGACLNVCPGMQLHNRLISNQFITEDSNKILETKIIWSSDDVVRFKAASGGFITGLAINLIEDKIVDGIICVKPNKLNPLGSEVFIAKSREDIIEASGSRYIPSSNCLYLKNVINLKGKYVFVGKPCEIEGLVNLEKIYPKLKERVIYKIALMCHHTPRREGVMNYLNKKNINIDEIRNITFRGEGWPGKVKIELINNEKVEDDYFNVWNNYLSKAIPYRCSICDNPLGHYSDACVGDPWSRDFNNEKKGKSLVVVYDKNLNEIINQYINEDKLKGYKVDTNYIYDCQKNLMSKKHNYLHVLIGYNLAFFRFSNSFKILFKAKPNNYKAIIKHWLKNKIYRYLKKQYY